MKRFISGSLVGVAMLSLSVMSAGAEELTVKSILTSHKAGAPANGIVAMVNSQDNSVAMTAGDLVRLRDAGVPENVIAAIYARLPAPAPSPVPLVPDDSSLVDLVSLIKSGISTSIIAEQVKQSGHAYNLSVNDLLYLKQNGAPELIIASLMTTGTGAAPAVGSGGTPTAPKEMVFDGLLMKAPFMRKNRTGRLVMQGDTLAWMDNLDAKKNLSLKITGLEKVWLSCQAQSPENFCYQISFQIVKGDRYQFQDIKRESGSNAAILKVMEALRTYYPRLSYGAPDNS